MMDMNDLGFLAVCFGPLYLMVSVLALADLDKKTTKKEFRTQLFMACFWLPCLMALPALCIWDDIKNYKNLPEEE